MELNFVNIIRTEWDCFDVAKSYSILMMSAGKNQAQYVIYETPSHATFIHSWNRGKRFLGRENMGDAILYRWSAKAHKHKNSKIISNHRLQDTLWGLFRSDQDFQDTEQSRNIYDIMGLAWKVLSEGWNP